MSPLGLLKYIIRLNPQLGSKQLYKSDVSMSKPARASFEPGPRKSPQEQSACRGRGNKEN